MYQLIVMIGNLHVCRLLMDERMTFFLVNVITVDGYVQIEHVRERVLYLGI
jgi:hypothetical protein